MHHTPRTARILSTGELIRSGESYLCTSRRELLESLGAHPVRHRAQLRHGNPSPDRFASEFVTVIGPALAGPCRQSSARRRRRSAAPHVETAACKNRCGHPYSGSKSHRRESRSAPSLTAQSLRKAAAKI